MQFIIKSCLGLVLFLPFLSNAQSTYLPQDHKHKQLLERLEIKLQRNSDLNVATPDPLSRRIAVRVAEYADSIQRSDAAIFSSVDQHNIESLLMNNSEWVQGDKTRFAAKRTIWNTFYRSQANFIEVDEPDFFLALNPVLQGQLSKEQDNDENVFLNTRGLSFRGMIARRVGFSGYLTENQERAPEFVMNRVYSSPQAVPGVGYFKRFKNTALDYFDGRGSIHFTAAKYIDVQFGYDKNFIGNGYRSLFLSDFGNSYLFLKLNTRIWKLNYQNIFMELTPQYGRGGDRLLDKKYASIRHLSINATKWLNLGLFEAVIFGRKNTFDFTYLNPVMFLRVAEQQNGSPDNAMIGFDFKANIAKRVQLYGQWLLDEFKLSEVRAGNGWWGNKFGLQAGAKYVDAFSVNNLDLQGEINMVRPFTYSFRDSIGDYSHYNQPMAHPFGANFIEAVGIIRYQPHPKWRAMARLIYWQQGLDSANSNFGGNIFKLYQTRSRENGFTVPSGIKADGVNAHLLLSYEPLENLFIDASLLLRKYNAEGAPAFDRNTNMFTLGLRLNMFRRDYDY